MLQCDDGRQAKEFPVWGFNVRGGLRAVAESGGGGSGER